MEGDPSCTIKIDTPGKTISPLTLTPWHLKIDCTWEVVFCRGIFLNVKLNGKCFMLKFQLWISPYKHVAAHLQL